MKFYFAFLDRLTMINSDYDSITLNNLNKRDILKLKLRLIIHDWILDENNMTTDIKRKRNIYRPSFMRYMLVKKDTMSCRLYSSLSSISRTLNVSPKSIWKRLHSCRDIYRSKLSNYIIIKLDKKIKINYFEHDDIAMIRKYLENK